MSCSAACTVCELTSQSRQRAVTYDRRPSSRKSGKKLYDAIRLPTCDRASVNSRCTASGTSSGCADAKDAHGASAVERSASPTAVQSTLCIFPDESNT